MVYGQDGTARYVGLQRIEGSLGGKEGSFVVESNGDFDGGEAKGTWVVIAGSGTGDLAGLTGEGTFTAPLGEKATHQPGLHARVSSSVSHPPVGQARL